MVLPKSRVEGVIFKIIILQSPSKLNFFIEILIVIFLALISKSYRKLSCFLGEIFVEVIEFDLEFFFHIIIRVLQIDWLLNLSQDHIFIFNLFIFFIGHFLNFLRLGVKSLGSSCLVNLSKIERIIGIILNRNPLQLHLILIHFRLKKIY